jgi:uncharacterized membrane protein (DUF2068 family)
MAKLEQVRRSATGLRVIGVFEAAKGVLVLLVGFGLFSLIHHAAQDTGEEIVERFHLNLARKHPRILMYAATNLHNPQLRFLAVAALLYSTARFVEAYGLWRMRRWAEWFAILSGGVYLPLELYELIHHATLVKAVVLVINAGIVAYLVYFRWRQGRRQGNHGLYAYSDKVTVSHKGPEES